MAVIRSLALEPGKPIIADDAVRFGALVMGPMTATFTYILAVFTYGLTGDLAARHSMYPARMFTLPVTTNALTAWPMLFGAAAMALLWLATRLVALWPAGMRVPVVWPAVAAVALLAWTQALTWMPYGLPGLRVLVAVLCLTAIDMTVLVAIELRASEPVMTAILAPLVPPAWFVARAAVARARRGDTPDWRPVFTRLRLTDLSSGRGAPTASPARAQLWFEWRRHGWSLPALVGLVLPFELALLFLAGDTRPLVLLIVLGVLATPPFMAAFAATTVRRATAQAGEADGITPFLATRPLTSPALVGAKLTMALASTGITWLPVLVAIPAALALSGTWPVMSRFLRDVADVVGTARAVVLVLLVVLGLVTSTWGQLVQTLYIGLSGRAWVTRSFQAAALVLLIVIGPLLQWIHDDAGVRSAIWDAVPEALAALVALKMTLAARIAIGIHRSRLLSDRAQVAGAAIWMVLVLGLYGLLGWFTSGPVIPRYVLLLVAILAVPLARVSAAPLALAWSRHK